MPHFFVPPGNVRNGRFFIEGDEARHLAVVLRKKPGDCVLLFDGAEGNYWVKIESVTPHRVEGAILSETPAPAIPFKLRLFQALPKGDKFDFVLQKMTELGASEIVPVYTERSVTKIPPERLPERMRRWERIVMSAAKQSGLSQVPTVHSPFLYERAFSLCEKGSLILLPWESEDEALLRDVLKELKGKMVFNVFIGPEGGFSHHEVELAKRHGARLVSLGPLILRTETAGLFVASALMYEHGPRKEPS